MDGWMDRRRERAKTITLFSMWIVDKKMEHSFLNLVFQSNPNNSNNKNKNTHLQVYIGTDRFDPFVCVYVMVVVMMIDWAFFIYSTFMHNPTYTTWKCTAQVKFGEMRWDKWNDAHKNILTDENNGFQNRCLVWSHRFFHCCWCVYGISWYENNSAQIIRHIQMAFIGLQIQT